jgi:hypothetical protein
MQISFQSDRLKIYGRKDICECLHQDKMTLAVSITIKILNNLQALT